MFSEKELNLEETELRNRISNLDADQRARYDRLEQDSLKDPAIYLKLNWLFWAGAHHFYLHRWVRGLLNLALSLTGIYLVLSLTNPLIGLLALLAVVIIEIPQLMNARHLVHAFNIRVIQRCLQRV